MYANLNVTIYVDGEPEQIAAHQVIIGTAGDILVMIDGQDGTGSYAEPAGERLIAREDGPVTITASF